MVGNKTGNATAWIGALALAVILNVLFFGLMPGLLGRVPDKPPTSTIANPVHLERITPPPPEKSIPQQIRQVAPKRTKQMITAPTPLMAAEPRSDISPPPLDLSPQLPPLPSTMPVPFVQALTLPPVALEGPFSEAEVDVPPRPLAKHPPLYPLRAQRMGIEGKVMVEFTVAKSGQVQDVAIKEAQPRGVFEEAAIKTVASWRFSPGTLDGNPVDTRIVQPIIFSLEN